MPRLSKRQKLIQEQAASGKTYAINDSIELLQKLPAVKFVESIDVSINLGIDAKKSDQAVRGSTVLPHGTGKTIRVAVFAEGDKAKDAKDAGADVVGMADLAEEIKGGKMDFDVVIASPDAMGIVGRLGTILGPRGLMPNPKVGTVSPNISKAVKDAKGGQVRFRTDKQGIIHCVIGKMNFAAASLKENLEALLTDLKKLKPSSAKGTYIKKITLSSTMGPGLEVESNSLEF